jgi:RNA polymerase sigma-70 factor (ECF subfamily)
MASNEDSLRHLMVKAQQGDKRCYAMLLDECQKWLKRYYARKIPPAALDDLVQETLISVHRKLASYDASRPFLPWLAAIGRYRWIDHLRKVYRADETGLEEELLADPADEPVAAKVSLDKLLDMLPDKQSSVIRMVKIQGLSINEAADMSGQSESLVKVNIHRGIKKLNSLVENSE